jgi:rhamnosyl/mannosyltransferase
MPNLSAFWMLAVPAARTIPWLVHWHADVVASTIDRRLAIAYRVYRPFERMLLAKARIIVATSPAYLATSEPLRPWRNKCRVVPLGLATERYPAAGETALTRALALWGDAGKRVLAVGRLSYYKGHSHLIEAARITSDMRCVIVGEGEQCARLEAKISRFGLQQKVILAGRQPDDTLRALLQTCDCFCMPSIERTEAFGVALLEAMAYGRPCIVTDVAGSGMSWVVRDGESGIAVEAANGHALSAALNRLLGDGDLRRRLGAQARSDFAARFQIERPAQEIRQLYNVIIDAERGGVDES